MDGAGMNNSLPEVFIERMRKQLGHELSAFLHALDEPSVRGIRLNPFKPTESTCEYKKNGRIPWTENGYYLPVDSTAGSSIFHAVGAFYIQEPGAMLPAAVLNAKPGEKILDLCAAPGGKSTQIGCSMKGQGLLVCNEPVPKRAVILSGNIERMGLPNTVVTCEWPGKLAKQWPEGFDAVLVDAPCSGEGMFRRDPETRKEWSEEKAEGCAARQREILSAAALMVRPGGRLVYSTCTYNPAENEKNVSWFIDQHPEFQTEAFSLPEIDAPDGTYTCFPHRLQGEGQFVALFRKAGDGIADLSPDQIMPKPTCEEMKLFQTAFPDLPKPTHLFGKTLINCSHLPDLKGIRIYRAGLHLGETRGKVVIPDHAAALCICQNNVQTTGLNPETAVKYISGETVPGDAEGWTIMRYQGLNIGWGKGNGGVIKNHYPKSLRDIHIIP